MEEFYKNLSGRDERAEHCPAGDANRRLTGKFPARFDFGKS
jgi:hypothetical protein